MTRFPLFTPLRLHGLALAMLGLLAASCDSARSDKGASPAPSPSVALATSSPVAAKEITISAAASTQEVIDALAAEFSRGRSVKVKINAGPSSGLATQILEGAPADLFLSANRDWADRVDKEGHVQSRQDLLTNALVLVVPRGNPAGIHEPKDLLADKVQRLALAGETVPAGQYADQVLKKLELLEPLIQAKKIVRGQDVRTTLSHVDRGEADAGIVYSTDLAATKNVEEVYPFAPKLHDEIVYVLVLLKEGSAKPDAAAFFEFLQSPAAAASFQKVGFERIHREPNSN